MSDNVNFDIWKAVQDSKNIKINKWYNSIKSQKIFNFTFLNKETALRCEKCNNILIKEYQYCPYCGCFIDWDKYDNIGTNN